MHLIAKNPIRPYQLKPPGFGENSFHGNYTGFLFLISRSSELLSEDTPDP